MAFGNAEPVVYGFTRGLSREQVPPHKLSVIIVYVNVHFPQGGSGRTSPPELSAPGCASRKRDITYVSKQCKR